MPKAKVRVREGFGLTRYGQNQNSEVFTLEEREVDVALIEKNSYRQPCLEIILAEEKPKSKKE